MVFKTKRASFSFFKKRVFLVFAALSFFWLIIFSRFLLLQIIDSKKYQRLAFGQQQETLILEAKRGAIYDRNGKVLASNLPTESFFALAESVTNIHKVATKFSQLTGASYVDLQARLSKPKGFVWLKREIEDNLSRNIHALKLKGVYSQHETKRYYPFGNLGKCFLGFTDVDNKGLGGVEFFYNELLSGKNGKGLFQRDALGNCFEMEENPLVKPQSGKSLVLTIDMELQTIIEEELKKGIEEFKAEGGTSLFLDPQTGEVLAMAYCYPNRDSESVEIKNRVIADNFEPGSTFKIVTAAAALETGLKKPTDVIYAEMGKYKFGKFKIRDVHPYKNLSFAEGMIFSSNIVMAKLGMQLGNQMLSKYARKFGFGSKTGVGLPGESPGQVSPPGKWPEITEANFAIGQGVAVTALQLVCAYAAVANAGKMMKPYLIKAILDENESVIEEFQPEFARQAILPQTARTLKEFLKGVVAYGTGMTTKIEGISLAGKTGTAQKPKENSRGYEEDKYISSFIGFFPTENPIMVGLVILDSPKGQHFGAITAGPVFKSIVEKIISKQKTPFWEKGNTTQWIYQTVSSVPSREKKEFKKSSSSVSNNFAVPELVGLTAKEAVEKLMSQKMKFKLKGSGMVVKQTPSSGNFLASSDSCLIECASY
jgi:cell division protein FtsI (penicillin-binding protein 3)